MLIGVLFVVLLGVSLGPDYLCRAGVAVRHSCVGCTVGCMIGCAILGVWTVVCFVEMAAVLAVWLVVLVGCVVGCMIGSVPDDMVGCIGYVFSTMVR